MCQEIPSTLPLYSEMGRCGGYKILETYKIPPITFTPQETYALFFSIKSMELMKSIPFQAEYSTIQEKFLDTVPPKIKHVLDQINSRVSFGSLKIINECPLLEIMLNAVMKQSVLSIVYQTLDKRSIRRIQPLGVLAEDGNWYCPSFDIDKNEYRLFRCDRITKIDILEDQPLENIMKFDLSNRYELVKKSSNSFEYKVEITQEGKSIYDRHHYPNMSLEEKNKKISINGWIEPSETEFLINFLHQFGPFLVNIYPDSLKLSFIKQIEKTLYRLNND